MKWSLYNFIIRNDSNYLLYNSLTNELMACVGAINSLLNEYKNNIDELKQIHPELYNYLDAQKFIVSDETNEAKQFIKKPLILRMIRYGSLLIQHWIAI